MSCIISAFVSATFFLIISRRAHTGATRLGLDFSQAHSGWRTQIEEPFVSYLNNAFSASTFLSYHQHPLIVIQLVKCARIVHCLEPWRLRSKTPSPLHHPLEQMVNAFHMETHSRMLQRMDRRMPVKQSTSRINHDVGQQHI
jgi:hypothetical protein